MKKTLIIWLLSFSGFLCAGCFDDKGNYDYVDVNQFILKGPNTSDSRYSIVIGETFDIKPTLEFTKGEGDIERLQFKWYLGEDNYTQEDWNTLNFKWTPDRMLTSEPLRLEATDPVTGLQNFLEISLTTRSKHDTRGVLVLSEENGKTVYSFIQIPEKSIYSQYTGINKGWHFDQYKEYKDIYREENNEDLPKDPIRIHQHFCSDGATAGQILILTENGAIDIDGKVFEKDPIGELSRVFLDGSYPAGCDYISDALFMTRVDLVSDPDGHIYSRIKDTHSLFHSGYFYPSRLMFEGKELSGCKLIEAPYVFLCGCMIYNPEDQCLLMVGDTGGVSGAPEAGAGQTTRLTEFLDTEPPTTSTAGLDVNAVYTSLNDLSNADEILHITYNQDISFTMGYLMVFMKDGKYYCQEFTVYKNFSSFEYEINTPIINSIKGLPGKPTCIYAPSHKNSNPLLFMSIGNDLYIYDRHNPSLPARKYKEDGFRAEIVAMDGQGFNSPWLAIGLSDGSVLIINSWGANEVNSGQYIYYDSLKKMTKRPERPKKDGEESEEEEPFVETDPLTFGNIKDVRFKIQSGSGWDIQSNHL